MSETDVTLSLRPSSPGGLSESPFKPPSTRRESTKSPLQLKIDVTVEKKETKEHPHASSFGKSIVKLSGNYSKPGTFVTDRTLHISFPNESGIRTLNIIYDRQGQVNLPESKRKGVFKLLKGQRSDLVKVTPIEGPERVHFLHDIKAGRFDLVASSKGPALRQREPEGERISDELQLIRIWRTGDFLTYNVRTCKVNRLHSNIPNQGASFQATTGTVGNDNRRLFVQETDTERIFHRLVKDRPEIHGHGQNQSSISLNGLKERQIKRHPNDNLLKRRWSFSTVDASNFYRDYLIQDAITGSFTDRRYQPVKFNKFHQTKPDRRFNTHTLPEMFQQQRGMPFDPADALTESNLKCPVCKNYYDTRDRCPHVMHCLHTCCNSCLRNRVRAEMVQCPVCSEVHEVPNNEIELLAVDHAREHLVKFYKVKNRAHEVGCDSCDPRNRATHRCRECDEFLCGACTEAHKRTKVTKGHNIVAVETLKRSHLEEFHHKRTCPVPEHEDQHFSFYCYSKGCDMPICSLCAVNEHNKADGHDIRNINDVYIENKRMVESLLIDVKHKKNLADEAIQGVEDEIQNLYMKESATEEELDGAFQACQKQLEKRRNELKEKLAATSKAKKKGLESQLDKLIADKNSLDHSSQFTSNIMGYSDATEFLQMKDAIYTRLHDLKDMEVDNRPHNKADIKFNAPKMLDHFQKFSQKMGEVWSSTAFIPNTKVQTFDVGLGREETALLITLHDYERRPLAEPGVDIRVEVTNPLGKKARAQVMDCTESEGAYKALYQGSKLGDHRASVFVLGIPVIDPELTFKVRRPGALESDVMREYDEAIPQMGLDTTRGGDKSDEEGKSKIQKVRAYRVFGDIICPDFSFDALTCHPQNMVTVDSRTLKNVRGRIAHIGTALKNYRGAIGTKPFSKTGRFYFEVVAYFFIKRTLRSELIFEVAIARKSEIDKNYTVDGSPYAWTVGARRCALCGTVCLMAFHNGVRQYHNPLTESHAPGTTLRTTIGFLIDVRAKKLFIVDAKNRRLYYTLKNIDTSKPLWPVVAAYSTEYVSVSLSLKTGKDIQAVPDIPADV